MIYLYLKSLHLIFLIAWMVALLYLPRLYVYHSNISKGDSSYKIFLLMEIRLIRIIAIPSMILTFLFGYFLLQINSDLIYENYFQIKLLCIIMLTIYQIYLFYIHRSFRNKKNIKSSLFFKYINEIPTILMIIIILLVVLKPNIG